MNGNAPKSVQNDSTSYGKGAVLLRSSTGVADPRVPCSLPLFRLYQRRDQVVAALVGHDVHIGENAHPGEGCPCGQYEEDGDGEPELVKQRAERKDCRAHAQYT